MLVCPVWEDNIQNVAEGEFLRFSTASEHRLLKGHVPKNLTIVQGQASGLMRGLRIRFFDWRLTVGYPWTT